MNSANPRQYVYVIGSAVNYECGTTQFANDAAQVCEEIGADFRCDQGDAPLSAENDMHDDVSAGLRHVFRPFRACVACIATQGLRPGLHSCAALRLIDCRAEKGATGVMTVTVCMCRLNVVGEQQVHRGVRDFRRDQWDALAPKIACSTMF